MDGQFYDDVSIAANSKREQLMKEAEEYRLRRHLRALQRIEDDKKKSSSETDRKHGFRPGISSHPRPAH